METVNKQNNKLPWAMMLLFLVGGTIIAALMGAFIALICGSSERTVVFIFFAILMLSGAVAITVKSDNEIIAMLLAYPLFITGFVLLFAPKFHASPMIFIVEFLVAICAFLCSKTHTIGRILLFYALVLIPIIGFSFVDFRHIWDGENYFVIIFSFVIALIYMGIYGATIYPDNFKDYPPIVRHLKTLRFSTALISTGLIFSTVQIWIVFSIVLAAISMAVASVLLQKYVKGPKFYVGWFMALLCCAATAVYPPMAFAFLGILLAYTMFDYVGLAIFAIAFVRAVSVFYYDLDMLLIHKSYLLMASGAVFLLMFFIIKRLTKNEQN